MGNNCLFCSWLHVNGERPNYEFIDIIRDPSGMPTEDEENEGKRPNAENIYIENAPRDINNTPDRQKKVSIDDFTLVQVSKNLI